MDYLSKTKCKFGELKGKTIDSLKGLSVGSENVYFYTSDGFVYEMFHYPDCCESVQVEEIHGDVSDILNSEILLAEERIESPPNDSDTKHYDSATATFYRIQTIKGGITIRWLGESNGYYSERVDFCRYLA